MTRTYNYKPGNREKLIERMTQRMNEPERKEQFARMASRRMKAIHEAARNAMKDDNAR